MAYALLALAVWILAGCGSPDQYKKQGMEADSNKVDVAVGLDLGDEYAPWAREFILSMGRSRLRYNEGDTVHALYITDSLINAATQIFDTVPFHDTRSKFLLLILTDLHSQAITWQELTGDTALTRVRTERFQDLAIRVHALRDSVDRIPSAP